MKNPEPDAHLLRRIAVVGELAPATVARYMRGESVRGLSRLRIERALVRLGMVPPRKRAAR